MGAGATVWRGSVFNCPEINNEILLLLNINSTEQWHCNDGAITARIIRAENNNYTSQLTVNVSAELLGTDISCLHDSSGVTTIGTLNITSGNKAMFTHFGVQ